MSLGVECGGAVETIPDQDEARMFPTAQWRAAEWRERAFGLRPSQVVNDSIARWIGDRYLSGHGQNPYFPAERESLPPGRDASWARGTWASVPGARADRWTDLWVECHP